MKRFVLVIITGILSQLGFSQYTTVDVSGYVVNDLGEPWSDQQAMVCALKRN
jgi:hypothetical protein